MAQHTKKCPTILHVKGDLSLIDTSYNAQQEALCRLAHPDNKRFLVVPTNFSRLGEGWR